MSPRGPSKATGGPPQPAVVVVHPHVPPRGAAALLDAVTKRILSTGYKLTPVRTEGHSVVDAEHGFSKKIELLHPTDAIALYRLLHKNPVAVITASAVHVLRDPSGSRSRRNLRTLEDFVRYKGVIRLLRSSADIDSAFVAFDAYIPSVGCTGESDARILPFHSFETDEEWPSLGDAHTDQAFQDRFGPAGHRTDAGGRRWIRTDVYHGREPQIVAGYRLVDGFHWDVKGDHGTKRLVTPHQVWALQGRSAYLNVGPNNAVRPTHSKNSGRLKWEAEPPTRRH